MILLKLFYYGNIKYNVEDFKNNILNQNYIEGIVLNTVMTKDGKIVVVSFESIENIVKEIEEYTYEQTKEENIILLDTVLNLIKDTNKRILINAIITPSLLNYKDLDTYTTNLINIIDKYNDINISVFSINYAIINFLKPKIKNNKLGILLSKENSNYIDVDFYIFPPLLLNTNILNQQYNQNKENMIYLQNWNDLNQVNTFFSNTINKSQMSKQLINEISILTMYPLITYNTIKTI